MTHLAPCALIVEDTPLHMLIAKSLLRQVGFTTIEAPSLLAGMEHARQVLAPGAATAPTLVLLDMMLPHEHCPILEGTALAAHLVEAMEVGQLQLAHIVAITAEWSEQREQEVRIAGGDRLLAKPLTPVHAAALRTLADTVPILPGQRARTLPPEIARIEQVARQAMRRDAAQLLQLLPREQMRAVGEQPSSVPPPMQWTAAGVRHLLVNPTALLEDDSWRVWVRTHGGLHQVREQLRTFWLPPDLAALRDVVLVHGDQWQRSAEQLNLTRSTYYRRLDELVQVLTAALDTSSVA